MTEHLGQMSQKRGKGVREKGILGWTTKTARSAKLGYEINFNHYFYQYQPPRPLEEIEAEIAAMLAYLT